MRREAAGHDGVGRSGPRQAAALRYTLTGASPNASRKKTRAMLPVLLDIVRGSATTPAERRQAALELGQYFLPKKPI
jgi:hypothetical protein